MELFNLNYAHNSGKTIPSNPSKNQRNISILSAYFSNSFSRFIVLNVDNIDYLAALHIVFY